MFNLDVEVESKILDGDIICLCETWRYENIITLPPFLEKYKINHQSKAPKEKDRGRASGG